MAAINWISYLIHQSSISVLIIVFVCIEWADFDVKLNRTNLHAFKYKLTGADLRVVSEVSAKLEESDIDYSLPTVFIAECVLVYMCTNKSSQLLSWIAKKFKSAFFINYEMVRRCALMVHVA